MPVDSSLANHPELGGAATVVPVANHPNRVHVVLEMTVAAIVLGIASVGLVGLGAAMLGHARPAVVAPIGLVFWAVLLWLWLPGRPQMDPRRVRNWVLVAGVLIILAFTVVNLVFRGEYVVTNRDPGIYSNGGAWIAQHGNLVVDSRQHILDGQTTLQANALGQQSLAGDDTRLEIQGAHLFPVLLAIGYWIGGAHGLFAVPALLGGVSLAVFFLVGLRFLPDWIALTVTVGLAVNFGWIYSVRSVLSEPLLLIFAFAGLTFTAQALLKPSLRRLLVAGFVVAVGLAARLDAGVAILLLLPAVAFLIGRAHRQSGGKGPNPWVQMACYAAGWVVPAAMAFVDLDKFSPFYVFFHKQDFTLVKAGLLAAVVVAGAALLVAVLFVGRSAGLLTRWAQRWSTRASTVALVLAAAVVVLGAFAWWLRPILWQISAPAGSGQAAMAAIQKRDGLPVNGDRTYDEISVVEVAWYIGPLVMAGAVLGIAVLIRRFALGRLPADLSLLLALVVPISVLYFYRTAIYPDQPWAIRRFVPVTIPGLLLFAGWFGAWWIARTSRTGGLLQNRPYLRGACAALVAAILLPPLFVTWPLKSASWEAGGADGIERLCDAVGPDGVAVLAQNVGAVMLPAVRGFCSPDIAAAMVSQTAAGNSFDPKTLAKLVSGAGRTLTVVAGSKSALVQLAPSATDVREISILATTEPVSTMERPPAQLGASVLSLWVGRVPTG